MSNQLRSGQPVSVVPIISGGLDSITMLYQLHGAGMRIRHAVSFNYGQRHVRELDAARAICNELDIAHQVVALGKSTIFGGALTDPAVSVPDGHYAEESMKETIVPGRNLIMLAIAAGIAEGLGADAVAIGVHAGDHFIYPDCRPLFINDARDAIEASTENKVTVLAPFLTLTKAQIAGLADETGVPIAKTWSCYKGGEIHCGTCGTCVERREAMMLAFVYDPTSYASTPPLPVAP